MSVPEVVHTAAALRSRLARDGGPVGFVPTMGALHEGHAQLMTHARELIGAGTSVVSIFVNPTQFGAGEDLDRYPRTVDADLEVCAVRGVDVVFAPSIDEVYPGGLPEVTVDPGPIGSILEGASRQGHFAGVATVVTKLFGLVRPDVAVFGQKDYQQLCLIRRMVSDLCLGVEIVGVPTHRDPDGLAMSSRNRFLSATERTQALALHRALTAAQAAGVHGYDAALDAAYSQLREAEGIDVDYVELRGTDLSDLKPDFAGEARMLIAARVGTTRLIDNLPVHLNTHAS